MPSMLQLAAPEDNRDTEILEVLTQLTKLEKEVRGDPGCGTLLHCIFEHMHMYCIRNHS